MYQIRVRATASSLRLSRSLFPSPTAQQPSSSSLDSTRLDLLFVAAAWWFAGAHQHPFNLSQWGAFLWSARDRICLVISQAGPATGVPGASSPSCPHRGICSCQPAPRIVSVPVDCPLHPSSSYSYSPPPPLRLAGLLSKEEEALACATILLFPRFRQVLIID